MGGLASDGVVSGDALKRETCRGGESRKESGGSGWGGR